MEVMIETWCGIDVHQSLSFVVF